MVAGIAYSATWGVGLSVFSSTTTVSSSGRELLGQYVGHSARLATQFVLTEGLAGLLLLLVVLAVAVRLRATTMAAVVALSGSAAVIISLVQCAIGLHMATTEVPRRQVVTIAQVADALNRLDGLKMTLLAITFGCLAAVVRRGGVSLPRGLAVVFVATALTLLISAAGYLTLNDHLATAAFASLPLLMASVTASGIALGRRLPARPGRA